MSFIRLRRALPKIWTWGKAEAFRMTLSLGMALIMAQFISALGGLVSFRSLILLIITIFGSDGSDKDFSWSNVWSDETFGLVIVSLGILTICGRGIIAVFLRGSAWYRHLQTTNGDATEISPTTLPALQTSVTKLRLRARQLRQNGQWILGMIALLVLLGFLMFQGSDTGVIQLYDNLSTPLKLQERNLNQEIENLARSEANPGNTAVLADKRAALKKVESELSEMSPPRSFAMFLLLVMSTKIAAIVFLVFLVQLLGNIYRYLTRLAFFADSRADILELVGSPPTTEILIEMLVPERAVEMDQMPGFPVLDQLRDILKTVSGKK